MGNDFDHGRAILKSFAVSCVLFVLTLIGMAEMTGSKATILGMQVGGHLSDEMRRSVWVFLAGSASQTAQTVATTTQGASNTGAEATTSGSGSSATTTTSAGSTTGDTQQPTVVITGIQGGVAGETGGGGTTTSNIEISAQVVNAQLSFQQASAVSAAEPATLNNVAFAMNDAESFSVVADGVPGTSYVLEATFDFQNWQALAKNYPDSSRVEFAVSRGSGIHRGFMRVRALLPSSAEVMAVGALRAQ